MNPIVIGLSPPADVDAPFSESLFPHPVNGPTTTTTAKASKHAARETRRSMISPFRGKKRGITPAFSRDPKGSAERERHFQPITKVRERVARGRVRPRARHRLTEVQNALETKPKP